MNQLFKDNKVSLVGYAILGLLFLSLYCALRFIPADIMIFSVKLISWVFWVVVLIIFVFGILNWKLMTQNHRLIWVAFIVFSLTSYLNTQQEEKIHSNINECIIHYSDDNDNVFLNRALECVDKELPGN